MVDKESPWSDMEWQIRNWNYFTWLGGDHIVEQHVHNLDVMNWVLGTHPVRAVSGLGGHQARKASGRDAFTITSPLSSSTQAASPSSASAVRSAVVTTSSARLSIGSKGHSNCSDQIETKGGSGRWRSRGENPSPYHQEHQDLIASIFAGKPIQ